MRHIGLVGVVLLAAGCAGTGNGYLAWQMKYARDIPDPEARASAFASVARSGAYVGDADAVLSALRELRDDPRHDEVAAECAVHMNQAGHPPEAKRVAKRIGDPGRRQEVLDKLAPRSEAAAADKPAP